MLFKIEVNVCKTESALALLNNEEWQFTKIYRVLDGPPSSNCTGCLFLYTISVNKEFELNGKNKYIFTNDVYLFYNKELFTWSSATINLTQHSYLRKLLQ